MAKAATITWTVRFTRRRAVGDMRAVPLARPLPFRLAGTTRARDRGGSVLAVVGWHRGRGGIGHPQGSSP